MDINQISFLTVSCLHRLTSISLGHDVGDVAVWSEGEVEDVGGVVLSGQRVKHLAVNSDLDVRPLSVTHLKNKDTNSRSTKKTWKRHLSCSCNYCPYFLSPVPVVDAHIKGGQRNVLLNSCLANQRKVRLKEAGLKRPVLETGFTERLLQGVRKIRIILNFESSKASLAKSKYKNMEQ